jgi:hypothetical protein
MSDDNVIYLGGKKYQSPANMEDRQELYETIRDLDTYRFKKFIEKNIPELVRAGWLSKTPEQLVLIMHEMRSQYIGLGEDFIKSRNFLRAKQFNYNLEEAQTKPLCGTCRWFREPPEGEERACVHLGSIPQDICCRGYTP